VKPVMNWVRTHLSIVVLIAVTILVLPVAFIGSSYWNGKIRKNREAAATKAMNDLNILRVSYILPSPLPGGTPVMQDAEAPNPQLTEFFRGKRQELEAQVGQVVNIAEEVNRRAPMMPGVFPTPSDPVKTYEMATLLVGRGEAPSIYDRLLKQINAAGPTDHAALAESLSEIQQQAREKLYSDTGRQNMSPEETAELTKELAARRLGAYQQHAREISVYATTDCLPPDVPRSLPSESTDVNTCFKWQWDYWVIEDLLKAVDAANRSNGARTTVLDSVVKRIEQISLAPLDFTPPSNDMTMGGGPAAPTSITGRQSGGGNGLYDIREARISVIVASAKLPQFFDAIGRTNFMTVTGLNVEDVDEWAELENGYFYGSDHVVRAMVDVETIWLRSWTVPLMPAQTREILVGAGSMEMAPPPPPPPPPPAAATPKSKSKTTGTKRPGATKMGGDDGGF
jgi:hypothetical protein